MKYLLGAVTIVVVIVAAVAITSATRRAASVTNISTFSPGSGQPEENIPPGLVGRDQAIEQGRARARSFGDRAAVLVDSTLTTSLDARKRVDPQGWQKPESPPLVADDAPVWLVRLRGRFMAPHPMLKIDKETKQPIKPEPKPGWMYTIIDATTGRTLESGFDTESAPTR